MRGSGNPARRDCQKAGKRCSFSARGQPPVYPAPRLRFHARPFRRPARRPHLRRDRPDVRRRSAGRHPHARQHGVPPPVGGHRDHRAGHRWRRRIPRARSRLGGRPGALHPRGHARRRVQGRRARLVGDRHASSRRSCPTTRTFRWCSTRCSPRDGATSSAARTWSSAIRELLVPQSTVVTPNIPELRRLALVDDDEDPDHAECARRLLDAGCEYVLVTGTHDATAAVVNTLHHRGRHRPLRHLAAPARQLPRLRLHARLGHRREPRARARRRRRRPRGAGLHLAGPRARFPARHGPAHPRSPLLGARRR